MTFCTNGPFLQGARRFSTGSIWGRILIVGLIDHHLKNYIKINKNSREIIMTTNSVLQFHEKKSLKKHSFSWYCYLINIGLIDYYILGVQTKNGFGSGHCIPQCLQFLPLVFQMFHQGLCGIAWPFHVFWPLPLAKELLTIRPPVGISEVSRVPEKKVSGIGNNQFEKCIILD